MAGLKDLKNKKVTLKGQEHQLAWINPEEESLLKRVGGSGETGPMGIQAYPTAGMTTHEEDEEAGPVDTDDTWTIDDWKDLVDRNIGFGIEGPYGYERPPPELGKALYDRMAPHEKNELTYEEWDNLGKPGWNPEGKVDPFDFFQDAQTASAFGGRFTVTGEGEISPDMTEILAKRKQDMLAGLNPVERQKLIDAGKMIDIESDVDLWGDIEGNRGKAYGAEWYTHHDPLTGKPLSWVEEDLRNPYSKKSQEFARRGLKQREQETVQKQMSRAYDYYDKQISKHGITSKEKKEAEQTLLDTLDIIDKRGMVNKKGWAKDAADWQKQDLGIVDRNPLLGLASLLATAVNPMHLQNFMMLNKATKPGKSYDFVNRQIELGLLPENRPSMFRKRKKRRPKRRPVCPPNVPPQYCPPGSVRRAEGGLVGYANGGLTGQTESIIEDSGVEAIVANTSNMNNYQDVINDAITTLTEFGKSGRTEPPQGQDSGIAGLPGMEGDEGLPSDMAMMGGLPPEEGENEFMEMFSESFTGGPGDEGGGLTEVAEVGEETGETFEDPSLSSEFLPLPPPPSDTMAARGGGFVKGPGGGLDDMVPAYIEGGEVEGYAGGGGLSGLPSRHLDTHQPQISSSGRQAAKLSSNEFVIPADVVADLGDGSTEQGARELYGLMNNVRQMKHGTKKQPPRLPASASGLMGLA